MRPMQARKSQKMTFFETKQMCYPWEDHNPGKEEDTRRMFVGGEFYYDPAWVLDTPSISTDGMYFLNGGTACLAVISDFLLDHGIGKVLLPSYLCPSIVRTFERGGITWDFYQVNEDFSIDLEDFAKKVTGFRAVYFINYFGFFHNEKTQEFFQQLKQNEILVIEDNAQVGFHHHLTGDFVLNSVRKLTAYDGGYLITRYPITPYLNQYRGYPNRRLPLIREYRERLYHYLFDNACSYDDLVSLFERATDYYETDLVVLGDIDERRQIECLDWKGIWQARRENFQYMMNWVSSIPELTPIFPELQADNAPFGLPVYFTGVARDSVYEALGKAGIGLTIHWEEICTDPRTMQNKRAVDMAGKILTLTIDQRMRKKQMDYLAMSLIRGIAAAKDG
jgi:dTDP-4-amino-4,6-dideoxygalactose transaminase